MSHFADEDVVIAASEIKRPLETAYLEEPVAAEGKVSAMATPGLAAQSRREPDGGVVAVGKLAVAPAEAGVEFRSGECGADYQVNIGVGEWLDHAEQPLG